MRVSGQDRNLGPPPFSLGAPPFSPPRREGGKRCPRRKLEFCFGKRPPSHTLTGRAGKKARGQGRQSPAKTGRTTHRSSAVRVPTPHLPASVTPSSTLTLICGASPKQAKPAFAGY